MWILPHLTLTCFVWILNHIVSLQWFLDRMADDDWWPMQILIKCPNQIVRQVRKVSLKESGFWFVPNWLINIIENNLQSSVSYHRSLSFSSSLLIPVVTMKWQELSPLYKKTNYYCQLFSSLQRLPRVL